MSVEVDQVRIRNLRERLALTQDELAEMSGVKRGTVSRIEVGAVKPRAKTVRALAAALGVEPQELIQEPETV